jgi:hypothetical protein
LVNPKIKNFVFPLMIEVNLLLYNSHVDVIDKFATYTILR